MPAPSPVACLAAPTSRADAASNQLRESIVTGALPPGALLKDQATAAQLGLSPIPFREATVKLAAEGLIERHPNRSKRVAPLDPPRMVELLEVQQHLWELGYAWGAPRLQPPDLHMLAAIHAAYETACTDAALDPAILAAMDFHRVFLHASANRELLRVSLDRLPLIRRFILLAAPTMLSPHTLALHRDILAAAHAADPDRCVTLFRAVGDHLLRTARQARDHSP